MAYREISAAPIIMGGGNRPFRDGNPPAEQHPEA
jgi:hypothetical protein